MGEVLLNFSLYQRIGADCTVCVVTSTATSRMTLYQTQITSNLIDEPILTHSLNPGGSEPPINVHLDQLR